MEEIIVFQKTPSLMVMWNSIPDPDSDFDSDKIKAKQKAEYERIIS